MDNNKMSVIEKLIAINLQPPFSNKVYISTHLTSNNNNTCFWHHFNNYGIDWNAFILSLISICNLITIL